MMSKTLIKCDKSLLGRSITKTDVFTELAWCVLVCLGWMAQSKYGQT